MMREALESLVSAIENGRTDIVRSIVSACEKCEIEDEGDITMDSLLNTPSTIFGTVLHLATKLDDADSVRTLLSAGANPEIKNSEGQTPLDLATSPKVCDVFNQELLQCIAQSNTERVCQLLAANVSVNLIDSPDSANTPLHWAACYANKETVQCLIKRNASVNALNNDGATPLHDAVARGELEVTEALLEAGASTSIASRSGKFEGKTPNNLAKDKPELLALLEKYSYKTKANGYLEEDNVSKTGDEDTTEKSLLIDNGLGVDRAGSKVSDSTSSSPKISKVDADIQPSKEIEEASEELKESVQDSVDGSECDETFKLLWPRPKHILYRQDLPFIIPEKLIVFLVTPSSQDLFHASLNVWQRRQSSLKKMDIDLEVEPQIRGQNETNPQHISCEVNPRLFSKEQAYRINVTNLKIKMQASCVRGLSYAINTLLQLITLSDKRGIQQLQIHDWPCIRDRAVLLDFSKGRIPHMETLKNQIEIFSTLNINQVQIYTRFKIPKDTEPEWQLPHSKSSLLQLDGLCQSHNMELVPMIDVAPSVDYFDLVSMRNAFLNFVQCFPSSQVVGVGPRLTSLIADSAEEGVLHMDEMDALLPVSGHQLVQLCAFIFHESASFEKLPPNTMLTEYGFEAMYNFDKFCKTFAENGVPFAVMAGTSAWNSLAGCPEAALANISNAVECAVSRQALSVIIANWASSSHMTHQPISWPGYLVASGMSWNSSIQMDFLHANISELLNQHVFKDKADVTGQVIVELGRAETFILRTSRKQTGNDFSNMPPEKGSVLYQLLTHPDQVNLENLSPEVFQKTMRHVRKCVSELSHADLQCEESVKILNDLQLTGDLVLSACRVGRALGHAGRNPNMGSQAGYAVVNLGVANLSATAKTDLANRFLPQIETFKKVWLERALPNSLQDALGAFAVMLKQFIPQGHTSEVSD